jgi:S-adenosylmethionine:tRNA ribosyltransferase-isomerase
MELNIHDFTYDLPDERIALYPLEQRDHSKLLFYNKGTITHRHFYDLPSLIPSGAFLFFNDTKVIPARLHFQKDTGADIEIFLLNPIQPSPLLVETMQATATCTWHCTIGNAKRWKEGTVLKKKLNDLELNATFINKEDGLVTFEWNGALSFAEVVSLAGETPLPPYLKREADEHDRERYQTIYSHHAGAVAAPTAGLHFTERILNELKNRNILSDFVTLHVSAGTFQPVKTDDPREHVMHREQIVVSKKNIENLLQYHHFIIPVGTTSMRTLESLYWYGVKLLQNPAADFVILQDEPYQGLDEGISPWRALEAVYAAFEQRDIDVMTGETSIFIMPGYKFKICKGLITNFHQPGSTLMLLVAAFIGADWRKVYQTALDNEYRFLSYGDSSLLLPG